MTDPVRPALGISVFGVLGVFLAAAPWTPVWDEGTFFLLSTSAAWVRSGWFRGMVSGLGILDLAVALREAVRFFRVFGRRSGGDGS